MNILLIEDDAGLVELITTCLKEFGWAVISATSGTEALAHLKKQTPDLMLLDYSLPDMNGKELIEILIKQQTPLPPFIITTGQGDERIAVDMMKLGAMDYLIKDMFFLEKLPDVVKRVLKEIESDGKLKQAEETLKRSEELFKAITENLSDVIVIFDKSGIITYKSPNITEHFGWLPEDLVGKHSLFTVHPDDKKRVGDELLKIIKKPDTSIKVEYRYRSKNGTYTDIELSAINKLDDPIINGVIANYRDITERKLSEIALHESKERLDLAIRGGNAGIWDFDLIKNELVWDDKMFSIYGVSRESFGGEYATWKNCIHPDDISRSDAEVQLALSGEKEFDTEFRVIWPDGSIHTILGIADVHRDASGKPYRMVGTNVDITERKQAEIEKIKLQGQLAQALKMEAIGTLAGGIAHDFNNILGVIMGYTDLSIANQSDTKKVIKNLKKVMNASIRAKEMVQQILAFSRKGEGTMRSVSIGKIIKEVISFLRTSIPTTVEIKTKIDKDLALVFGNPTQINQVLMNLCTNSAHAMKENGGLLNIELKKIMLETDDSKSLKMKPGDYQVLTVSDTGSGIKKDIIDRIFDPYFTTKDTGEGTGMGLAVIYGIIKNHGGEINVYSEPGKGTVFNVYFPVPVGSLTEKSDSTDTDQPQIMGNNEMILLVDDEQMLAELGTQMLEELGYQVESRTSSIEALKAFKADPDKYDLIVTDMTMPDMTGVKLASEIHKIRSDISVILCTGFSDGINKKNYKAQGISALIIKPVITRELAETISEVLKNKLDKH